MDAHKKTSPRHLRTYLFLFLLLIVVGAAVYFFYGDRLRDGTFFTRYDRRPAQVAEPDTPVDILPLGFSDTLVTADSLDAGGLDSLVFTPSEPVDSLPTLPLEAFPVTASSEIEPDTLVTETSSAARPDEFDLLLPATFRSPTAEATFLRAYRRQVISSRGLYKLAAIAARGLLAEEQADFPAILHALEVETGVSGIIVCDRAGRVVYGTDTKLRGQDIRAIYPALPVTSESLNWMRRDGRLIVAIPVFSLGGRSGAVYVITEEE